jgi:hypothetical protein
MAIALLTVLAVAIGWSSPRVLREVKNYCDARLAGLRAYDLAFARVRKQMEQPAAAAEGKHHGAA